MPPAGKGTTEVLIWSRFGVEDQEFRLPHAEFLNVYLILGRLGSERYASRVRDMDLELVICI